MTDFLRRLPSKSSRVMFAKGPGRGLCKWMKGLNGGRLLKPPRCWKPWLKPPGCGGGPIGGPMGGGGTDMLMLTKFDGGGWANSMIF